MKDLVDEIIAEEFASPYLELVWLSEDDNDLGKNEAALESRLKLGALTLNELRDGLGLDPYANPAADRPMVLTATGYVPIEANVGREGSDAGGHALELKSDPPSAHTSVLKAVADDPKHPGWPAGTSGGVGGQFRPKESDGTRPSGNSPVISDVTPDNTWKPGAQYAAGWPHHYMPWANFRDLPLKPETRRVFVDATSGPLADTRVNRWSPEHAAYNDAVNEAFQAFLKSNNITAEQMTPEQADEFIDEIFFSRDPRIRNFNRRIWSEAFRYWRRSEGGRGGDPD